MSRFERANMVPGERYLVIIDDCCVGGAFTASFAGWETEVVRTDGDSQEFWMARFDNGVSLSDGPGWSVEPVGAGDDVALRLLESVDL